MNPTDIQALLSEARTLGVDPSLLDAVSSQYLPKNEDIPEVPPEPAVEAKNKADEVLSVVQEAQKLGIDPKLIDAVAKEHLSDYKDILEQEQVGNVAAQQQANRTLEGAEDTALENLYEGAGQIAAGGVGLATDVSDLMLSPFRLAYRGVTGEGITTGEVLGKIDPRLDPNNADFVEEPLLKEGLEAVGGLVAAGGSFANVARDPSKASSVFYDMMGFGSSEAPVAAVSGDVAARSRAAVAARTGESKAVDITTDEGVLEIANSVARRMEVEDNINNFEAFEEVSAAVPAWNKAVAKLQDKWTKATERLNQYAEEGIEGPRLEKAEQKVQDILTEMEELKLQDPMLVSPKLDKGGRGAYNAKRSAVLDTLESMGVGRKYADELIASQGGVYKTRGFQELIDFDAADAAKLYDGNGTGVTGLQSILRPASAMMRDKVGSVPSYLFERAMEKTARAQELLTIKYNRDEDALRALSEWAESGTNKQKFLDLRNNPQYLGELLSDAKNKLTPAQYELFTELVKDSKKHQKEMSRVFKPSVQKDEHFWASSKKAADKADETDDYVAGAATSASTADKIKQADSVTGVQVRSRKSAFDMEADELDRYANPILEQIRRLNQEQALKNITNNFRMRPSLDIGDDSKQFFQAFEDTIGRQSGSKAKARTAREIVENTYLGTTKRPPKGVEIFMKQAYAGTLGQLDSALLNLHDVFVSMQRNGVKPTLKAILDKEGMDITDLGIGGDVKSLGEFQQSFENTLEKGGLDSFIKGLEWYQRKSFKWSGFRLMDRAGKGVVMRASLNKARAAAKGNRLDAEFGHMMRPEELTKIQGVLKSGVKLEDMPKQARDLVEDLMFARLGEQQLISAAGRPLAYMKHPGFRWAYALSGFAIKQMEMMKVGAYDAIKKGEYADAGKFLASYFMFASGGYALTNNLRGLPQAMLGNEDKNPSAERFIRDLLVEQPLSVASYNRLGSSYSNQQFAEDPVGYTMESLAPPAGFVGNVSKDVSRAIRGKEPQFYTLNSIPYGDELRAILKD